MGSKSEVKCVSLSLVGSIGGGVLSDYPRETIGPFLGGVPAKLIKYFSCSWAEEIGDWSLNGDERFGRG